MINRRTRASVSRVIRSLDAGKHGSDPIYIGGPVEMTAVFGLVKSRKKPDKGIPVLRDLYLLSSKAMLEKTLAAVSDSSDLRLYVGYCGWAAGQLEDEVRRGGWWIFDGNVALVFDPSPGSVWSRLIGRTERQIVDTGRLSILAEISGALRADSGQQGAL
jgi:putative transcriptional regulator